MRKYITLQVYIVLAKLQHFKKIVKKFNSS